MAMTEAELKRRTQMFAITCLKMVDTHSRNRACEVYGKQLIRSSSSVGANYRAVCAAKSAADMITKLTIVQEEADESAYWVELLVLSGHLSEADAAPILKEAQELTAIVVASRLTLKRRPPKPG
ncbi:MAG TPA: four helix bundle protein [Fimbriimonadaceae bacterium]|jgi:four helix bundle protein